MILLHKLRLAACITLLGAAGLAPAAEPCAPFEGGLVKQEILDAMRAAGDQGRLYRVVPGASRVGFCVRHFPFQELRGEFTNIVGGLALPPAEEQHGQALLLIHTAEMEASNNDLLPLLRSHEFMDTERYPEILFVGHTFEWHNHPVHGHVYGDLTLHGVTQPAVIDLDLDMLEGFEDNRPARIHLSGYGQVNRMEFDMRSYRFLVSHTVRLCLSVELTPWEN